MIDKDHLTKDISPDNPSIQFKVVKHFTVDIYEYLFSFRYDFVNQEDIKQFLKGESPTGYAQLLVSKKKLDQSTLDKIIRIDDSVSNANDAVDIVCSLVGD